jgi:hypothetical protein
MSSNAAFTVGGSLIAAGSTQDSKFTAIPASIGQAVLVSPLAPLDASWAGMIWTAWVCAENKICIRLANLTVLAARPTLRKFTAN